MIKNDLKELVHESGYSMNEILSRRRQSELVDAREVIVKALLKKGYTFSAIGRAMNRDHTSIIHLSRR